MSKKENIFKRIKDKIAISKQGERIQEYHKIKKISQVTIAPGKPTSPFVLWPNSEIDLNARGIDKGLYRFTIEHSDSYVKENRKSLISYVHYNNEDMTHELAKELLLGLASNGHAFSYIGGGRTKAGKVIQVFDVRFPEKPKKITIRIRNNNNRVININKTSIEKNDAKIYNIYDHITKFYMNNSSVRETEFIVYADIDPNVTDGSSIWLSSVTRMVKDVGKTLIVLKSDPNYNSVISDLLEDGSISVVSPSTLSLPSGQISIDDACAIIREIDAASPNIRRVITRGLRESYSLLSTRQFFERSGVYLTNFYEVTNGRLVIPMEKERKAQTIANQASAFLVQTSQIEDRLSDVAGRPLKTISFPPPLPRDLPTIEVRSKIHSPVRIGYAGKVTPDWGLTELIAWIDKLQESNIEIELHIIVAKYSESSGPNKTNGFIEYIKQEFQRVNAVTHEKMSRSQAISHLSGMDFVWCWRPAHFECNTAEVSTKLIEAVACGYRAICYPSPVNIDLLGEEYPFFAKEPDTVRRFIDDNAGSDINICESIRRKFSYSKISHRLSREFLPQSVHSYPRICVAGHDFKFIDPFISHLKSEGHSVIRDVWDWGTPKDLSKSRQFAEWADIIFCEWGLQNAVWHSQNRPNGTKLFVRVHLQEINARAQKFGSQIAVENVDKFIFVQDEVREKAIELWNWPREKTIVIPNFVLTNEYIMTNQPHSDQVRLGMVGIVPQRKRFDRAVQLLEILLENEIDAHLSIKGPRPETLDFMHAPGRVNELEYYQTVYDRIARDPAIRHRVTYEPWGNDVAVWYRNIDHILSPSDFESFHYALADGVLSGCHPIVWPWTGADKVYERNWIVQNTEEAAAKIMRWQQLPDRERHSQRSVNRNMLVQRYGQSVIFKKLADLLGV